MKRSFWALGLALWTLGTLAGQDVFEFSENGAKRKFELYNPPSGEAGQSRQAGGKAAAAAPISFVDQSELPTEKRLAQMSPEDRAKRMESASRQLTTKLLVRSGAPSLEALRAATGYLKQEESLLQGWTMVTYENPTAALQAVRWLAKQQGQEYMPVFARQQHTRQAPANPYAAPLQRTVNDPLYPNQWHLNSETLDISLKAAWDYVTGKGINVTIVDDGMQVAHPDLVENAYPLDSNFHRNFNGGPENDPTPDTAKSNHGTACAGLVGARGFNGIGLSGVAPEAKLMGLRLIAGPSADDAEGVAFGWQPEGQITHVSSNSWGPTDDGKAAGRLSALAAAGQEKAATKNRDGLGTVVVISAGNGRQEGDNSSYDAYSSTRFGISVGAVNRKGEASSFSEEGVAVAISAFGGEFNPPETIWTTNNSGEEALAILKAAKETSQAPVDYTDAFNGTSAAAPQVSGAAALLLERNPKLGYRDVKEILMRSARQEGLLPADSFVKNGGGFLFSNAFGAGLLNVAGALALAENWKNLGELQSVEKTGAESGVAISEDLKAGAPAEITFDLSDVDLRVEAVEFEVNVQHPYRGEVGFILTSPSGMRSLVEVRGPDDTANFQDFLFTSVRHWGESSKGVWKIRAIDIKENGSGGVFQSAKLRVFGTVPVPPPAE
ncbi:MAG: S8 family serine peptidase [Acidobacteria bacterium]|nr:S8 family serine peptidase [Acidobacteriota bacterium]